MFSFLFFTVTSTALPWNFYFFKLTQPHTVSVKEKGGKPDRKPHPFPMFKKSIRKPQVWELSRLCPVTSMKLYVVRSFRDASSGGQKIHGIGNPRHNVQGHNDQRQSSRHPCKHMDSMKNNRGSRLYRKNLSSHWILNKFGKEKGGGETEFSW